MKEDEEAAEKRRKSLLEEQGAIACKICYMDVDLGAEGEESTFLLSNCEHMFHQVCLNQYVEHEIGNGGFPINCAEDGCKKEIAFHDIKGLVSEEMVDKFYKFSFNKYVTENPKDVSVCPTADCNFAFYWAEEDGKEFDCPECKNKYCLDCKADWHEGMTCAEFRVSRSKDENDVKFEKFVNGSNFKKCPHCGFWVERAFVSSVFD